MENTIKNILHKNQELLEAKPLPLGHESRFIKKLNHRKRLEEDKEKSPQLSLVKARDSKMVWKKYSRHFWRMAASIAILFGVFQWGAHSQNTQSKVAAIAPEASALNQYYPALITAAVKEIESQSNALTKPHIEKAFKEISKLEQNFSQLEQALINGGNSKLILKAMIENYTNRIDLLQEVMSQLNTINTINSTIDGTL